VLTVISNSELLTEMLTRLLWDKATWFVLFFIEIFKASLRFVMLYRLKGRILAQQTIPHRDTLLNAVKNPNTSLHAKPAQPTLPRVIGEILYICRPLVYLSMLYILGKKSWSPWVISFAVDILGRTCTGNIDNANEPEKDEITRRMVSWLYYLIRSPFFEDASKNSMVIMLYKVLAHIPIINWIIEPILGYIVSYRNYYFYTAGSS